MGYRSQVECCIYGDPKDCATFLLKEAELIHQIIEDWQDFDPSSDEGVTLYSPNDANLMILHMNDVKWYEGYDTVDRFMKLLQNIRLEAEKDTPAYEMTYEFIRVGEESGDIEDLSCGDPEGKLCTSTTILRSY